MNKGKKLKFNNLEFNPRKTDDQRLDKLEINLNELGDLSGVVHNLETDEIICGNQRSKVMKINSKMIEIYLQNDTPDQQGTVALGYINYNGNKYNYRQVRWNQEQVEKAVIIANVHAGSWDFEALGSWDSNFLKESGFNDWEMSMIEKSDSNKYAEKNKEINMDDLEDYIKLVLNFDVETYNLVKSELSKIDQSPESAILKLLNIDAII